MIYQLTYDLRSSEKNYSELYDYLEKELAAKSIHVLPTAWWFFIEDRQDKDFKLDEVSDTIKALMDKNDVFYISAIHEGEINGYMGSPAWNWYLGIAASESKKA